MKECHASFKSVTKRGMAGNIAVDLTVMTHTMPTNYMFGHDQRLMVITQQE